MKPSEFLKKNGDAMMPHLFEELDKRFIDKEEFNQELEQLKLEIDTLSFVGSGFNRKYVSLETVNKKIEELKK